MPSANPNPFPSATAQPIPALNLFPLNDSFIPKHIHLNQRVKIGRQTNAKTVPGERNGYFDSKVLSRAHAEVWEEAGKIYIKDVKSSNGTFINGERLSPEGVESDPFELKSDDIVEFGIDIVGEDNKTIIHHKVAARVTCVLSPDDALGPAPSTISAGPTNPNNSAAVPAPYAFRPAQSRPSPTAGLGSMGAPAGKSKSGLTFEHILSRLQNGLIQSRETGQELGRLGDQMGDIGDTLGGNNPGPVHTYPHALPPVRPHVPVPEQQPTVPSHNPPSNDPAAPPSLPSQHHLSLQTLQAQLAETQATLAAHVEKIRLLEEGGGEVRREVGALRGLVGAGADDDARSVATVTDAPSRMRPRTPEPSYGDDEEGEDEVDPGYQRFPTPAEPSQDTIRPSSPPPPQPASPSPALAHKLTLLADQLETALAISRTLQAQQSAAQSTIQGLEAKVVALEEMMRGVREREQEREEQQKREEADAESRKEHAESRQGHLESQQGQAELQQENAESQPQPPQPQPQPQPLQSHLQQDPHLQHDRHNASPTLELLTWQRGLEQEWTTVREEWAHERARLDRAREEWEGRVHAVGVGAGVASGVAGSGTFAGLVTPPSPRSLSADSNKPRRRRSRSRSRRSRSRSRSRGKGVPRGKKTRSGSPAPAPNGTSVHVLAEDAVLVYKDARPQSAPIASVSTATAVGIILLSVAAAAVYRVRE